MLNLATWNIRGLNKVYKHREVKEFLKDNKIALIILVEHRIKLPNLAKITKNLIGCIVIIQLKV